MRTRLGLAVATALLLPLVLTGCTVTPYVRVFTNAQQPVHLTAAGEYYLDTICPRNAAIYAYDAVRKSDDLATLHSVAVSARAASSTAAAGLRASAAPWPSGLRPQVELLAESLDLDAASYGRLATAPTVEAARSVAWPGQTSAGDARFVIRRTIGLSDGTQYDDCVGHYGGATSAAATPST